MIRLVGKAALGEGKQKHCSQHNDTFGYKEPGHVCPGDELIHKPVDGCIMSSMEQSCQQHAAVCVVIQPDDDDSSEKLSDRQNTQKNEEQGELAVSLYDQVR